MHRQCSADSRKAHIKGALRITARYSRKAQKNCCRKNESGLFTENEKGLFRKIPEQPLLYLVFTVLSVSAHAEES